MSAILICGRLLAMVSLFFFQAGLGSASQTRNA
jgi:hypothetical protein